MSELDRHRVKRFRKKEPFVTEPHLCGWFFPKVEKWLFLAEFDYEFKETKGEGPFSILHYPASRAPRMDGSDMSYASSVELRIYGDEAHHICYKLWFSNTDHYSGRLEDV